jgi:hypothetical protein
MWTIAVTGETKDPIPPSEVPTSPKALPALRARA